jgi:sec-independent protein translocase protein TatB
MLPDLSPAHIFIVVAVALIVVGPKDLPMLLRKIGQFVGRMRGMANEFKASFDEMARQSELDDLRKEVEAMRAAATNNLTVPDLGLNEARPLAHWEMADTATPEVDHYPSIQPPEPAEPPMSVTAEPAPAKAPRKPRKPNPPAQATESEA